MRAEHNLGALILAAGNSSRAPGFKPMLHLGAGTVIENSIFCFLKANITNITVVTGYRSGEILPVLEGLAIRHVFNEKHEKGMFSSVLTGVQSLHPGTDAFFLLPADMPLVKSHTIKILARAFRRTQADIVYPVFQGERGHPPLISTRLLPKIMAWEGAGGLRQLLEQHEQGALEVEVVDEGILFDIDTTEDYHRSVALQNCRYFPSKNECDFILSMQKAPANVVRHCEKVAEVAGSLAFRLNQAGFSLNIGLIEAAALLHDLAKGRPDHPSVGARILKKAGYPRVAVIVAAHAELAAGMESILDDTAIVYLADKLVQNDRIVSIMERFTSALDKHFANEKAVTAIRERMAKAEIIRRKIERALEEDLYSIVPSENRILQNAGRR